MRKNTSSPIAWYRQNDHSYAPKSHLAGTDIPIWSFLRMVASSGDPLEDDSPSTSLVTFDYQWTASQAL
jgi:hypothetical protein